MQTTAYAPLMQLGLSLLLGLLIGSERGWQEREQSDGRRVAGLRTFILFAALGGVSALLDSQNGFNGLLMGFVFLGLCALVIAAHIISAASDNDLGITTAASALLTYWLGVMPHFELSLEASSLAVVITLLLHYKQTIHRWLKQLQSPELRGMLQFLVIAVVLLPLLPARTIDPWQTINPAKIGWLVVLISGLGMLGYFATHWLSARFGILMTSFFGGLVSSTAVTVSLARMQHRWQAATTLSAAILLACGMMYLRLAIIVALLTPTLFELLAIPLLCAAFILLLWAIWLWRRQQSPIQAVDLPLRNPFELGKALQFAALLTSVLVIVTLTKTWLGDAGLYPLAVLSGLTDVDAISLSLVEQYQQGLSSKVASLGILLAATSNTLIKGVLAWIAGGRAIGIHCLSACATAVAMSVLLAWLS
ncbi:MgtC/SapB family protein [Aliagarivorans marinus]|uniref:MgtC/SapB family protein n=1 Tax=Aliagarivorans marinus TaxID=561965 RepID=UPI00047A98D6|nr:MgtC/SapB family protein [Aliagarivorans marinus]